MTKNIELIIYLVVGLLLILALSEITRSVLKKRKENYQIFINRWKNLMNLAKKKSQWNQLIIEADKLLNDVLKYKHYKGKNLADKIVSAQRQFKNNDKIWSCHKLANKIQQDGYVLNDKQQLLDAVNCYREAFNDLGIFKKDKSSIDEK